MKTVNGPHVGRIFSEGQHVSLTKILTKSQYFCNMLQSLRISQFTQTTKEHQSRNPQVFLIVSTLLRAK